MEQSGRMPFSQARGCRGLSREEAESWDNLFMSLRKYPTRPEVWSRERGNLKTIYNLFTISPFPEPSILPVIGISKNYITAADFMWCPRARGPVSSGPPQAATPRKKIRKLNGRTVYKKESGISRRKAAPTGKWTAIGFGDD